MKILLVYNIKTAHKVSAKKLSVVKALLTENKIDAEIVYTQYPRHAVEIVCNVDFNNYDGIVSAGGDGTLYEVVNGYFQNKSEKRIPLGVIPVGTGNAFVKDIGLTTNDLQKAMKLIKNGFTRKVDVAQFKTSSRTSYFINILGFGFVTDVVQTARHFKLFGDFAYTIGVLHRMLLLRTNKMRIEIDGKGFEYEQLLVEISNSRYTGASYLMAPNASITDGYLDVIVAKKMGRIKLLSLFSKIFKGEHIGDPYIDTFKARQIKIELDKVKPLSPDGELEGITPVEITCLPQAIEIFAPAE